MQCKNQFSYLCRIGIALLLSDPGYIEVLFFYKVATMTTIFCNDRGLRPIRCELIFAFKNSLKTKHSKI